MSVIENWNYQKEYVYGFQCWNGTQIYVAQVGIVFFTLLGEEKD